MTQMTQSVFSSLSAPAVNEEGILEQVLSTGQGHKTGVGCTLSQRIHDDTSLSSSRSEGTSAHVDLHRRISVHILWAEPLDVRESSDDARVAGTTVPEHTVPDDYTSKAVCPFRSSTSSWCWRDDVSDVANLWDT